MQICHHKTDLHQQVSQWKQAGDTVALVPTMGNLHEGHLSLVRQAQQEADRVVVSIFVNPTQFGPDEDFDSYPRTLEADSTKLEALETDLIFAPDVSTMYPQENYTWVDVDHLGDYLCGANRPGHFRGVCTVVSKLFNLVQPDAACFGEKDFQQLAIIRRMTDDLCFPVRIVGVPIARAESGLALSSRNGYLTHSQRQQAAILQQQLQQLRAAIQQGNRHYAQLAKSVGQQLQQNGLKVDYIRIMDADALTPATADTRHLLLALACYLGQTRLIDNIAFYLERD